MSYTEYMRTKLSSQPKVVNVRNPTDASMYTQKQRLESSYRFFTDGTSKGSLATATDRNLGDGVKSHSVASYTKASARPTDASTYTAYRGSQAIGTDSPYQAGGRKQLPCVDPVACPPTPGNWKYSSASDAMRSSSCEVKCRQPHNANELGGPLFVDNTIRLSAQHPRMVATDGCCDHQISDANHTHSSGIQVDVDNQRYAVGKPFFMASPPLPETPNTSGHKVGAYYTPKSGYVENKHGYVAPSGPIPVAPGGQGQIIDHLKINNPTLFVQKPF